MDQPSDKPNRPVLRLVKATAEPTAPSAETPASAQDCGAPAKPPKSALGKFMTAYADAIDRDIRLLMEL